MLLGCKKNGDTIDGLNSSKSIGPLCTYCYIYPLLPK